MTNRKKPSRIDPLTYEELEILTDIAFAIGEWFMKGMIHSADEYKQKQLAVEKEKKERKQDEGQK